MDKEKILKMQALAYLGKNNWGTAIGGFFVMILPFLLVILGESSIVSFLNIYFDLENLDILNSTIILGIEFIVIVTVIMLSPALTGYQRLCYKISKGEKAELTDVFYYFRGSLYGKCLALNIRVLVRMLVYFLWFGVLGYFALVHNVFKNNTLFYLFIFFIVILTIGAVFILLRYTVVSCVFFEDESLSSKEIVKLGVMFSKEKLSTINMLTLTFFPYLLLCFFVLPLIFVVPYLTVTYMTNGKWITQLHKTENNENYVAENGYYQNY